MKIIVISDTHLPIRARSLPEPLLKVLPGADLILHAGDWSDWSVYELLSRYAPVAGVAGNTDPPVIREKLGLTRIVEADTYRIGLVHGHIGSRSTEQNARSAFDQQPVDAIVFGHSHIPVHKRVDGILLFNPGSPTDRRRQPKFSFGILTTDNGQLQARHVFFDRK
ncbi:MULTISPECIES: metallophosphoesterase family protein [Paenibacillus]|uniref:Phosphoesterase n=1 Tax=Paenibacillus campinasensis TaxID=66347 RepID=A0A268EG52_9BACL|nr:MULTISPECIES: metallophosphoesterase [Paenibacillus]MUG67261.1 YfcE family phosphodiesterase [Paenibacillus campinasensis]PAD72115.1 YfcE family phosphodiesterase [Paenibacillus campinasensis]PAK49053.1 YfcE family phosphodiesterase [Paenibacillus sp. 7541]